MIITETGILVSTDPNMKEPAPLNFKIEGGQVGDNSVRATGLTGNTTYYAQSYFVKDGIYIRQKGLTEFKTAAQEEVLKIKNAYAGSNTIGINKSGDPYSISLDYSTDSGETWSTWNSDSGNFSVTLAEGEEVWLKGNNNRISTGDNNYYKFTSTGIFDCEGNLSSLLRKDLSILLDYCFYNLFSGSAIRIAPDIPAIDLSRSCYGRMFYNCTALTTAPALPATVLSNNCYEYMFYGCTALTTAPALPATTLAGSCYRYMFSICSSLAQAPALPATTLANGCYEYMFSSCTSLTQAPALPATTLAGSCYNSMFYNCTALTTAPALPATTIAGSCYRRMFYNCTSLAQAPTTLPATTLAGSCYYQMFQNCTSLTKSPDLPATTLADYCYYGMFDHCSALTQAPATLPATTLNYYCYYQMFYYCSSLRTAPDLPATSLTTSCYYRMFDGCSVLNKIICYATSWGSQNAYGWVTGVAATGDFYNLGGANIPIDSEHGVPIGWTLHTSLPPRIGDPLSITNTSANRNTVELKKSDTPTNITVEYSTDDGSTWASWNTYNGDLSVDLPANGKLMVRGNNATFSGNGGYFYFASSDTVLLNGDVNTLINTAGGDRQLELSMLSHLFAGMDKADIGDLFLPSTTLSESCYAYMFHNCSSLTKAPILPATTLAKTCYLAMFYGCTALTQAPEIPATSIPNSACIQMFRDCTALTDAPALHATTVAIYGCQSMFSGCTALATVPNNMLPATTVIKECYRGMFNGCTALTAAPALPATDLTYGDGCYNGMFGGCTALTTAPALPATTLAYECYSNMFYGCSSLVTAPAIPATQMPQSCCYSMFKNCTSLNRIEIHATNINSGALTNWVDGAGNGSGDFYNIGMATLPSGANGIPTGWTEHTSL